MTLPDKLTLSRIFLVFIFIPLVFSSSLLAKVLALFTFLLASFTDFLDGFIAKEQNISTDFGKLMDPIADKILVLAAFIAFVELGIVPAWMVVIIVLREIAITALRILALTKNKIIPSDGGGKQKMVSQVASIFAILLFLIFKEAGIKVFSFWNEDVERLYANVIYALMLVTTALTLISGAGYLSRNRGIYSDERPR